jgi:hypothetical protein
MKLIIIAALTAFTLLATEPVKQEQPKVQDRPLTDAEALSTRLDNQKIQVEREKYHLDEFEKAIQEPQTHFSQVVIDACKSIGIPLEKVQTECGFQNGHDPATDKPLVGQDGKALAAHVWRILPTPPAATPAPAEK